MGKEGWNSGVFPRGQPAVAGGLPVFGRNFEAKYGLSKPPLIPRMAEFGGNFDLL
ncbi:MAG: hypothetical protein NT002_04980 [candidate division Zixibacteria bacterium]|nr:hypothetical protein [candidate division Zixibacteria bacterium]